MFDSNSNWRLPIIRRKNGYGPSALQPLRLTSGSTVRGLAIGQGALIGDRREILIPFANVFAQILYTFSDRVSQPLRVEWLNQAKWREVTIGSRPSYEFTGDRAQWGRCLIGVSLAATASPVHDFACSFVEYLTEPELLRQRSPERHEYLRTKIFAGYQYRNVIRPDLRFSVLNLRPDYTAPGTIRSVDAVVTGDAMENKTIAVRVSLNGDDNQFAGAKSGFLRLINHVNRQQLTVSLSPSNPDPLSLTSLTLHGHLIVNKYDPSGLYQFDSGMLFDQNENSTAIDKSAIRIEVMIRNSLQAPPPPQLIPGTQNLGITETTWRNKPAAEFTFSVGFDNPESIEYAQAQIIEIDGVDSNLKVPINLSRNKSDPSLFSGTITIPHARSGRYAISYVQWQGVRRFMHSFSVDPDVGPSQLSPIVEFSSPNEDTLAPDVDINSVTVTAAPVNPLSPDGRTTITVKFNILEDKAGIQSLGAYLKSPNDRFLFFPVFLTPHQLDSCGVWQTATATINLPLGSIPGEWGLSQITSRDNAYNTSHRSFVELVRFKVP